MDSPKKPDGADGMLEAIALSSPSGHMSKRARKAAEKRLAIMLFGPSGQPEKFPPKQESPKENKLRRAGELRALASRGMKPRVYRKEADRLEKEADLL